MTKPNMKMLLQNGQKALSHLSLLLEVAVYYEQRTAIGGWMR